MFNQFRYILLFCFVLSGGFKAAAQFAMPDNVCIGAAKHYNVDPNPVPGSTYSWRIDGVTQVSFTTNEIDITWNTIGTYLLEVQELSNHGCLGPIRSGQVFVHPLPNAVAGADRTICLNASTTLGAAAVTGSTYSWSSVPAGFTSTEANPTVIPLVTTIYTVIETITATGCTNSNSVVVTVNPNLPVSVSIAASENPVCAGTLVTFTATPTNEGTTPVYQWYVNSVAVGTNNPIYAYVPVTGDQVYVVLASNATCAAGSPATSNTLTMTVTATPIANAGPDDLACQGIPFTVSMASAQNYSSVLWTTTGTGVLINENTLFPTYTPGLIETGNVILTLFVSGNVPCGTISDFMVLNVITAPTTWAGPDTTIYQGMSCTINQAYATNTSTVYWTHNGLGTLVNPATLYPTYIPAVNEFGDVTLTLSGFGFSPCGTAVDDMVIHIIPYATAVAGPDLVICGIVPVPIIGSSASNYISLLWTTSGTGTFDDATILHPVYTPSQDDMNIGFVMLILSANPGSNFPVTSDTMSLTIFTPPTASAGTDGVTCQDTPFTVKDAYVTNSSTILWTHNGFGTLTGATTISPVYTPDPVESGIVVLTLTANGIPPCGPASDPMTLTIIHAPIASVGPDLSTCPGQSVEITEASAQNYSSLLWTHNGLGSLSNTTTLTPVYTPNPSEQGSIILTLTVYGMEVCSDTVVQLQLTITIHQLILVNAGPTQAIPAGTSTWLSGQATGGSGAFAFEWQPAPLVLDYTTQNPETVILTEPVTFWLTVTDLLTGCKAMDSVRITISSHNLPPVAVDDYDTTGMNNPVTINVLANDYDPDGKIASITLLGGPNNGQVVLNSDSTITYTPRTGFTGIDSLNYFICGSNVPVLCDTASVYILVIGRSPTSRLIIYNVITPNGDGDNDLWIIDGIEEYPVNSVAIFNRWGDKINNYERYDNKTVVWNGTNQKGYLVPDGTYYYILSIKDIDAMTGWIFVRNGSQ